LILYIKKGARVNLYGPGTQSDAAAKQRTTGTAHNIYGVITALFQISSPTELNANGNRVSGNSSEVSGNFQLLRQRRTCVKRRQPNLLGPD